MKEGNLQAPQRQPIDWRGAVFWDSTALESELERVFDICHGCRRCVSLCKSFPVLFDLVDTSETLEVDGVDKAAYSKVVDECYLCDLCAETKCPYLPPHEWAVDFPHLMLRAKAQKFRAKQSKWRDRLITSVGQIVPPLTTPGIAGAVNALNNNGFFRTLLQAVLGIHKQAPLPKLPTKSARKRLVRHRAAEDNIQATEKTTGKVALFTTCYGDHLEPQTVQDMVAVFTHNDIAISLLPQEHCCGMPKLELGDLEAVARLKEANFPLLLAALDEGYDLIAPIPSCVLMFKQELPLLYSDDPDAQRIKARFFDPFEYLMHRHKAGLLNTQFKQPLGKVAYHVACHQRVQRIGRQTKNLFALIPGTDLAMIERCSGHDGTYAWKKESYQHAAKIAQPVVQHFKKAQPDFGMSDCLMAGRMIAQGLAEDAQVAHPIQLLRRAYGL